MFNKLKFLSIMKKIKLFAIAAFAMLSTNVFAQSNGSSATKVFTFDHAYNAKTGACTATITGFVADLDDEFKAAVAIPETVTHPTEKDGEGNPVKYFVTAIAKSTTGDGFLDEPIETITFPAAVPEDDYEGIEDIGAGVFQGTKIKSLDLTNTKITTVRNYFATAINAAPTPDVINGYLTSVTLPATVTSIASNAFVNCIKLETVNMSAATGIVEDGTKGTGIGAGAFAGCPLKELDLSKNEKVTGLVAKTLYDGTRYKSSTALTTVKLHQAFTTLNNNLQGAAKLTTVIGHIYTSPSKKDYYAMKVLAANEFKGCAALTTFETKYITTFNDGCFDGCAALATASLESATKVGVRSFAGTALESVTFPAAGLTAIGDKAFFECASLKTATLATTGSPAATAVASIGIQAFAYTAIGSFTIPESSAKFEVGSKAFAGTPIETFTWNATAYDGKAGGQLIADDIFSKCSDVVFKTTDAFVTAWQKTGGEHAAGKSLANGPTNSTFSTVQADPNVKFTTTEFKTNKYYVKWFGQSVAPDVFTCIQVKRSDCKVYAAFLEGDGSLAMIQYKADSKGIITIMNNDAALIITDNKDLTYVKVNDAKAVTTSWMTSPSKSYDAAEWTNADDEKAATKTNQLRYCTKATTRGTLENQLNDDSYFIYGWMKSGGFQKIASGTTIPAGTLFAFAKQPVDAARMTVKWYDENGNLEAETTAIDAIEAVAPQAEGQRYNVAGQKVSASYKGLVIKDGKKYMQK